MLFGLLVTLYVLVCLLLVLLVLVQKGKSSMGIGNLGGGVQMLFGGSGGQDIFQKTTWALGAIFMAGSLGLSLLKTHSLQQSKYLQKARSAVTLPQNVVQQEPTQQQ
jgi:preprotein translocase subunit SecG